MYISIISLYNKRYKTSIYERGYLVMYIKKFRDVRMISML